VPTPSTHRHQTVGDDSIAIVVLTHNRCHLLRECVENVLMRTSALTREIVVWNNASTDETADYLETVRDPRVRVVNSRRNIGVNAYARAFETTRAAYLIELDDDVVDAPGKWDATLVHALRRLPDFGYLAASLVEDEQDVQARLMYDLKAHLYHLEEQAGIRLKVDGPVGGWCAITPREVYERVGGFGQRRRVFWLEDEAYVESLGRLGMRCGYLDELRVRHAGGPYYAATVAPKARYLRTYTRQRATKNLLKSLLLSIPFVRALNTRNAWFEPPQESPDYLALYSA
jgi:GT2 family glycosyltransferase